MDTSQIAHSGTLESNDIMITLALRPPGSGLQIEIQSIVMQQYGDAIRQTITDTLSIQGITDVYIKAIDRGALDCTIKARLLTAAGRAGLALKEGIPS